MTSDNIPIALFLSPHFDDIALSCGGMAARLARTGARCIGLTVFTAPAPEDAPLSAYAQELHMAWERAGEPSESNTVQSINEVRREEERQAMRLLRLEPVWLDLPDAPYRRGATGAHLYTSDKDLFGTVSRHEQREVVPRIAEEIRRVAREAGVRGRVRVFAPLAVGHHVDHQLVFAATRRLGPRFGVVYYEDYPYAAKEGALIARLEELNRTAYPRLINMSELIGVKIAAIARYKSQLGVLFGGSDKMAAAVRAYSQSVAAPSGGIQHAERYWYIPPSYVVGVEG